MGNIARFALVLCLSLGGCHREETVSKTGPPAGAALKIVGSSTMTPVVYELARAFRATRPDVQFAIESGGSGRGLSEARAGTADIGMVSRALSDKETDLVGFSFARDGIGFLVHADNPVKALTTAQIRDIFSGRAATWKAVGGGEAPITVVTRPEGRSALEVFTHHFGLKPAEIKSASSAGENDEAVKAILTDRNAITFVSVGEAERRAAAGEPIRLLNVDGVAATSENLRTGKYPLSRSLTFVTRTLPKGAAKDFIDFASSNKAAPIIKKYDFVAYVD